LSAVRAAVRVGIDDGADVDTDLLSGIYERVRDSEFQPSADHVMQVLTVERLILGKKPVCMSVPTTTLRHLYKFLCCIITLTHSLDVYSLIH